MHEKKIKKKTETEKSDKNAWISSQSLPLIYESDSQSLLMGYACKVADIDRNSCRICKEQNTT